MENTPRIFVGDYASYNEGNISGDWFDLTDYDDYSEFYEAIEEMFKKLDKSHPLDFGLPREEQMFQDWENIPSEFIGESHISENFWPYMEVIEEKGWDEKQLKFALECVDNYDLTDKTNDLQEIFEEVHITECDKYDLGMHYLLNYLHLDKDAAEKVHSCVDDEYCINEMGHSGAVILFTGGKYWINECVEV
jgi:hypothetical protein